MKLELLPSTSKSRRPRHMTQLIGLTAMTMLAVSACKEAPDPATQPVGADGFTVSVDHSPEMPESPQAAGQDVVSVDPDDTEILSKTGFAEVIRVELPEDQALPAHNGGDRIVLSLNNYTLSFLELGESVIKRFEPGDVHYHPAGRHEVTNVGEAPVEMVIFERLTSGALPEGEPTGEDDTPQVGSDASEIMVFTNDAFDVYEVNVDPGGKLAPHQGFARAIYSLDNYDIKFHENGESIPRSFSAGQVHFHNPGTHWLENSGDTVAQFMVVDFKK